MKLSRFLFILLVTLTTGCTSPIVVDSKKQPELAAIRAEFASVVANAHNNDQINWVSGWSGNSAIAENPDGPIMGYCYEWQELVFAKVGRAVRTQGWDLVKININRDVFSEHHAVVVFDPKRITRDELLTRFGPAAFVLDAWQRGHPDVYTLEEWLSIPVIVFEAAALELEPGVYWRP